MAGSRALHLVLFTLLLQSCNSDDGSTQGVRTLSYEVLMQGLDLIHAIPLEEFSAPSNATAASNFFSGRLRLTGGAAANNFAMLVDDFGLFDQGMQELPEFNFEFVQHANRLIPLRHGPVGNKHPWWEFVLLPGYLWNEKTDNGFTRVALPFALKQRNEDCIHNGLISFLFDDTGRTSRAAFQVSNQTCKYLQFEMHGLLEASYDHRGLPGSAATVAAVTAHHDSRLPQRPIGQLDVDYVGAVPSEFGSAAEIDPLDMTAFGFIIDGVHYVGDCETPYGRYPYCDELALPSYSTAKSLVGGLGLMLAEKHYPGTAKSLIKDFVPECMDGWDGVTIEHALDMTTGHYGSLVPHADEDAAINSRFFSAEDHATKVDFACNEYTRKSDPGERWVYQTWSSYLAGTAINNRLKSLAGEDADFYDQLLVEKLWKPLCLSPLMNVTRRSNDIAAQPFTGFGLTLLRDDVAKLAQFIGSADGLIDGKRPLDQHLFDSIKQRDPADPGLPAELENIYYNNGFRSFDVAMILGCESPTWLLTMSGFGGINIVLMPNNTSYYYFSDGGVHRYLHAVRASHRIRSMCEG